MPVYEYVCTTCSHKFDKIQPMGATGAECPHCEQPAKKAISLFSATATSADGVPAPSGGHEWRRLLWGWLRLRVLSGPAPQKPRL